MFFFDYLVLFSYLFALIGIGLYFGRSEKNTADFFLGGSRIPWWAAGLSIFGTQLSAITFMAIPAKTYTEDWVYFFAQLCIVAVAPIVISFYLPFYRRLGIVSVYEYLERRFSIILRWFGSLSFLLFQLGRMGIVLALPALALSTVTGIDVYLCIVFMGVLATLYTTLGGIEAVVWSDVLQVFVLLGGAIISLVIVAQGVDGGLATVLKEGHAAGKFHAVNWSWDITTTSLWVVVLGNLFANLAPYTTDQTVVQRYLTTPTEGDAARSIWTNAALTIPASLLFFFLGTAFYVFYIHHPEALDANVQADAIFPWFIASELPMGLSGLVIAGLFAASMSSIDSSINSMAACLVTDFSPRSKRTSFAAGSLKLARAITLALGLTGTMTALFIASYEVQSLWDLFLRFVGLFGGSVAGVFILGIFTTRSNAAGALFGAIAGSICLFAVQQFTSVHFFLYTGIGILVCTLAGYVASRLLPPENKSLEGLTIHTT